MKLIAFCGLAGVGKDTAASRLMNKHGFLRYGFADPLKRGLEAMFGWPPEMWNSGGWKASPDPYLGFSPRKAAQTLGTEWGRDTLSEDLWLQLANIAYEAAEKRGYAGFVISDLRYENEAEWVEHNGGTICRIVRANVSKVRSHSSEDGIGEAFIHAEINNDSSLENLYTRVDGLLDG